MYDVYVCNDLLMILFSLSLSLSHCRLLSQVHAALTKGIALMIKMHTNLGKELYSIGWDVLIREVRYTDRLTRT
jgi:hypothetical protein